VRLLVWIALAGQLAMLADGALGVHVTCAEHGDVVHAAPGAAPAPVGDHAQLTAFVAAGSDTHDRCLLDEDGEVAPPPEPALILAAAPLAGSCVSFDQREHRRARRAPLYLLAPKNSPPV
jgi:hypothetical protein